MKNKVVYLTAELVQMFFSIVEVEYFMFNVREYLKPKPKNLTYLIPIKVRSMIMQPEQFDIANQPLHVMAVIEYKSELATTEFDQIHLLLYNAAEVTHEQVMNYIKENMTTKPTT